MKNTTMNTDHTMLEKTAGNISCGQRMERNGRYAAMGNSMT